MKLEVMRDKMVEDMEKRGINPKVTRERENSVNVVINRG